MGQQKTDVCCFLSCLMMGGWGIITDSRIRWFSFFTDDDDDVVMKFPLFPLSEKAPCAD